MASKTKLSMSGDVFKDYADKLEKLGGNLRGTVEKALEESAEYVNDNLERDIRPHKRSGKTAKSLRKDWKVEWQGMTASIPVGFDIDNGGLPSIFLMRGTPRHEPNHPGTEQDKKLFNDVYGSATEKKIKAIQEKIFAEEIEKLMNK